MERNFPAMIGAGAGVLARDSYTQHCQVLRCPWGREVSPQQVKRWPSVFKVTLPSPLRPKEAQGFH